MGLLQESMSCDEVISSLRGKVLKRPSKRIGKEKVRECDEEEWTPYNANMSMQGIKVLVREPLPEESKKSDSFEGTMLLLEIVREKNMKEVQRKKKVKKPCG